METTNSTPQKTWLGNILSKIFNFISNVKPEVHDFAVLADNLANTVKNVEASTVGQIFETGLEMIIPASVGLVSAFKLYWPKLILTLNLAASESGKSDSQIVLDGAAALQKMKSIDPNAYATTVTGIAANIKQFFLDNTGNGGTIQQAIITQIAAHDPNLTTVLAGSQVSQVSQASNITASNIPAG